MADAQDCAATDASRWQNLNFQSIDSDADGHWVNASGTLCVGSSLPSTHSATTAPAGNLDCNDNNATLWRMLPYVSRDADADGFSVALNGEVCSGENLPAGYGTTAPQAEDCDDSSATTWRFKMTYVDADGDGVGAGRGEVTCIGTGAPSNRSLLGYDPIDDPSDPDALSVSDNELPFWLLETP